MHIASYPYNNSISVSCHIIHFLLSRNKYGTKKGCRIGSLMSII
nr:MAG TPA: hypothetical protein [Caudoviricetes sp.]